jgi:hypothetical protein
MRTYEEIIGNAELEEVRSSASPIKNITSCD